MQSAIPSPPATAETAREHLTAKRSQTTFHLLPMPGSPGVSRLVADVVFEEDDKKIIPGRDSLALLSPAYGEGQLQSERYLRGDGEGSDHQGIEHRVRLTGPALSDDELRTPGMIRAEKWGAGTAKLGMISGALFAGGLALSVISGGMDADSASCLASKIRAAHFPLLSQDSMACVMDQLNTQSHAQSAPFKVGGGMIGAGIVGGVASFFGMIQSVPQKQEELGRIWREHHGGVEPGEQVIAQASQSFAPAAPAPAALDLGSFRAQRAEIQAHQPGVARATPKM